MLNRRRCKRVDKVWASSCAFTVNAASMPLLLLPCQGTSTVSSETDAIVLGSLSASLPRSFSLSLSLFRSLLYLFCSKCSRLSLLSPASSRRFSAPFFVSLLLPLAFLSLSPESSGSAFRSRSQSPISAILEFRAYWSAIFVKLLLPRPTPRYNKFDLDTEG